MYLSLLLLPMFGSAVAGLLGRKIGITGAHIITCSCLIISAILAIIAFYEVGLCGSPVSINLISWIDSELMDVSWGFMFDSLTVSMLKEDLTINTLFIIPVISIGKRWATIFKPKHVFPATDCKALVPWNSYTSMGSTLGYKTSFIRKCVQYYLSIIIMFWLDYY